MSGVSEQSAQADWILPPMVDSSGNPNVIVVSTSNTVVGVDLTTMPTSPYPASQGTVQQPSSNPLGHYLRIEAETVDHYILFGPTYASVTSSNAPASATTNTISSSGVITAAKQTACIIPAGTFKDFKLPAGAPAGGWGLQSPCRFLGIVTASSAGKARIYQSSI